MRGARGTIADVVAVLLLTTLVLSVLDDSFADRSYLVTGLVPVVVLLGAAALTRRLHEGVWWYALTALLLFAPLGAVAAFRRPGPYLVPTLETMNRVLGEIASAPSALVSTLPPVDPSGQVMLVPFMIGFLGAAPAAWLALATSRTLTPALPLVLALAATIPVGVLVPTLLVPRGVVFAILVVVWAALRARRSEALHGADRGSVAAALTAVLTVTLVSGLTSLLVPDDIEVDRVLLHGEGSSALVSGAAQSTVPQRTGRSNQLLKATGVPEGRRLRFAALDLYDGDSWVPAEESPGTNGYGTFKSVGHDVAALHPGLTVGVRVQIRPGYASDWLPMLGELTSLDLDYTDGRTQLAQVRYNQATSSALVVGGVDPRDDYTFASVLTEESFRADDAVRQPTDEERQPDGAFLDQYLTPFDREDLLPMQRVLLLARYLRLNGTVRLTGSSSQAPADLGRLLGSREMTATPFQYSAVMALGASRLGVPARVVTGAEPGRGGIVTYDDITSWVELQLGDGTWRPLDPERYVGVHQVADGEVEGAAAAGGWVKKWLEDDDKEEFRIPKGTEFEFPEGAEFDIREQRDIGAIVVRSAAAVLALLVLTLLLAPALKVLRRRRRRRTASLWVWYVNGWQEVLDTARDRGTPVPEEWSRVAQATVLGTGLELARRADAAVFAPGPGDVDLARDFWDACQALRRELLADADRRHRWWSSVNPASLLAGWARGRRDRSAVPQVRHEDRRAGSQQPSGA